GVRSGGGDVADERPVGVVDAEAEVEVQPGGPLVGRVDVEHAGALAPAVEVVEPGEHELAPEPPGVERGVDGDDVDLAERRVVVGVHLRPAEAGQPPVDLVEEEALGVEPRLRLPAAQVLERPAALLGVPVEGPVVQLEPRLLVPADDERAHLQVPRLAHGQGAAELPQVAARLEPDGGGQPVVGLGRLGDPEVDVAAPGPGDRGRRRPQHLLGGRQGLADPVGLVGVDQLELPAAPAPDHLRGGEGPAPGVPGHEVGRVAAPAEGAVVEQVLGDELVADRLLGRADELGDGGGVLGAALAGDLEPAHACRLGPPGSVRAMATARPRSPKGRARVVAERLAREYPGTAKELCALQHRNAYELLTATILSAQTTDERVNMVTPTLFAKYPTPHDLAAADPAEVEEIIRTTGFYRNKARSIIGMATALVERFGGEVPHKMSDLVTIPGVGRKTANVVRSVALGLPGLPV